MIQHGEQFGQKKFARFVIHHIPIWVLLLIVFSYTDKGAHSYEIHMVIYSIYIYLGSNGTVRPQYGLYLCFWATVWFRYTFLNYIFILLVTNCHEHNPAGPAMEPPRRKKEVAVGTAGEEV